MAPGAKRAIVAVGRSILIIIWHRLSYPDVRFCDLFASFYDTRINAERKRHNHVHQLEALSCKVFPQKLSNSERVLLTVLHLRRLCTLDVLADALGGVCRSAVGNAVRETRPLLEQDGRIPPPAAIRYRTATDSSPQQQPAAAHQQLDSSQLHKLRNVTDRLPDTVASTVAKRMRRAYRNPDPLLAEAELEALGP
jgi:hypothetical protein